MAVLKPKKQHKEQPRSFERPVTRSERSTLEEVPIHAIQKPPLQNRPPFDPRDPRDARMRPPQPPMRPRRSRFPTRLIASIVVAVLLLGALVFFLTSGNSTTVVEQHANTAPISGTELEKTTTPEQMAQAETILEGLRKHILLPSGTPQMMQINNPDDLIQKDQFFAGSQNGDVLLIYRDAGKALIYSPQRDIIVNVGPVQVDPPEAERTQ